MRIPTTLLAMVSSLAFAGDSAKQFAHVDFVRTAPGKNPAELQKAVEEKMAVYQKAVSEGKFVTWSHYQRLFPHGSGQGWSQVRFRLANSFAAAVEDANCGIPAALATSVSGELWELVCCAIEPVAVLKAKYVVALFRKMADGITPQAYEAYINGAPRARTEESVRKGNAGVGSMVFHVRFPGGTKSEYDYVTLTGYNDLDKASRPPLPPNPGADAADRAVRSTVRRELWRLGSRTQ